jgi:hypothetical protein
VWYAERAMFSEPVQAGFALAATIARDRGAELARPGVAAAALPGLCALARELEQLSRVERRERIRRLAPRALVLPLLHDLHVRASLPRMAGGTLPPPRAGYVPERALLVWLARIARRTAGS